MTSAILNCKSFVPPLLEGQLTPPYHTVKRLLGYLQKWREYLFGLFSDDYSNAEPQVIQSRVDELIKTIILVRLVNQYDTTAMPTLKKLLLQCSNEQNLYDTILGNVHNSILRSIFEPEDNNLPYWNDINKLSAISESIGILGISQLPVSIIGDFYQLCLDIPVAGIAMCKKQANRRNKGVYYTPAPLVDYLVYHALEDVFEDKTVDQILKTRILDPSCGCGTFTIATLRYILERLKGYRGYSRNLAAIMKSMLYATDIDSRAVLWTRKLILLTLWQYSRDLGLSCDDIELQYSTKNIICHNFLDIDSNTFGNTFCDFDVIVGGPPFVRVQELCQDDPEQLEKYKLKFKTASGQYDLYMLFMEKAIELLSQNGLLSMSVSNTFLHSMNGLTLRKLITETCAVKEILEFGDNNVYPDVQVRIALIRLQKTKNKIAAKHISVNNSKNLRKTLNIAANSNSIKVNEIDAVAYQTGNWIFNSQDELDFLNKIEKVGRPMGQLPIGVSFGIATGVDRIFFVKQIGEYSEDTVMAESKILDEVIEIEKDILMPILRGRNIKGYAPPEYGTMCICPYDRKGKLLTENILRSNFPKAYEYLGIFQEQLMQRKLRTDMPWYSFRNDIAKILAFPKIISSAVSSGRDFTLIDELHILCNNSCIVIQPDVGEINPYYLMGILNSSVFTKWAKLRMPSPSTGWIAYRLNILRQFPVICDVSAASEISSLVCLLCKTSITSTNKRKLLLAHIDKKVRLLYLGCN